MTDTAWEVFYMELPKNITQIGEVGGTCKIYVEDYVVSYMKQLNRAAQDKNMAVALYGKRREENGIVYYFLYGACKLDFLQREVRHLSQAQRQEMERFRRKYFPELALAGYRLLDGDMIEGFHICEQDICRYVSGYSQFYEKNDAMLAYMLDVRDEAPPEQVNQEKYEEIKRRQEERRMASQSQTGSTKASEGFEQRAERTARNTAGMRRMPASVNLQRMRLTAVGVFALLCLLGIATFRDGAVRESSDMDALEAANVGNVQKDTLIMEDKLDKVLLEENQAAQKETDVSEKASEAEQSTYPPQSSDARKPSESVQEQTSSVQQPSKGQEQTDSAQQPSKGQEQTDSAQQPSKGQEQTDSTQQPSKGQEQAGSAQQPSKGQEQAEPAASGSVAYIIQPGDTLIAISKRQYGTDIRVADICSLNKISNPDDIKEGQVIMLPR